MREPLCLRPRKKFLTSALVIVSLVALMAPATSSRAKVKGDQCDTTELKTKYCLVHLGNYSLQLNPQKLRVFNGVFRSIQKLPLVGEQVDWEFVRVKRLGDRLILELGFWEEPKTEVKIQSLHWIVYEIAEVEPLIRLQKVIQKRRDPRLKPKEPRVHRGLASDQRYTYGLKAKGNKIHWHFHLEKGSF